MYRFRGVVERPDWTPPQVVVIEATYDAEPEEVDPSDESLLGGVHNTDWQVVAVQGPAGQYHQPSAFSAARLALLSEAGFAEAIQRMCEQDFAQRRVSPWPESEN